MVAKLQLSHELSFLFAFVFRAKYRNYDNVINWFMSVWTPNMNSCGDATLWSLSQIKYSYFREDIFYRAQ